uniref:Uncharacterized protein n=1 Tax=Arundo donax TaxID=35708 RepID=A0A0A9GRV6_ARUDO
MIFPTSRNPSLQCSFSNEACSSAHSSYFLTYVILASTSTSNEARQIKYKDEAKLKGLKRAERCHMVT